MYIFHSRKTYNVCLIELLLFVIFVGSMQWIVLTIKTLLSNVATNIINTRLGRELFETLLCQLSDFFSHI